MVISLRSALKDYNYAERWYLGAVSICTSSYVPNTSNCNPCHVLYELVRSWEVVAIRIRILSTLELMTTIHSLHCSFINYNITDRAYRRTVISLPVLMTFCCRAIMSHARRTLSPQFQVRWTKNIRRHAKVDYFMSLIGSSWLRETEHFHFFYFKPWSPFKRTLFQPRYNSCKVTLDLSGHKDYSKFYHFLSFLTYFDQFHRMATNCQFCIANSSPLLISYVKWTSKSFMTHWVSHSKDN